MMYLDGDFPTDTPCKFHCSPTCHPCQTGPEWVYGCTHPAWPQNIVHDFVPIVDCGGNIEKCKIPQKLIKRMINGLKRRIANREKKIEEFKAQIEEIEKFKSRIGELTCPECNSRIMDNGYCMMGHWCGKPLR